MMKRFALIIGFLLFPLPAMAALPALSPWVQTVLEKADKGIATAASRPVDTACSGESDPVKKARLQQTAISDVQDSLRKGVDIRTQVGLEARALFEQNVCFRSDVRLIESKMQEVRNAMNDSIGRCNLVGANLLTQVYNLLVRAQQSLIAGGLDPTYRDELARTTFYFESEALVTTTNVAPETIDTESTAPSCPFTSDYAPHSYAYTQGIVSNEIFSFGCDEQVVGTLPESMQKEWEGQNKFLRDMSEVVGQLNTALQTFVTTMNQTIAYIRHGAPADTISTIPLRPIDVPHQKIDGCLRLDDADIAGLNAKALPYADDFSTAPRKKDDPQLPIGLLFRPAYDYFSLFQNPLTLLRRSADTKAQHGIERAILENMSEDKLTQLMSTVSMTEKDIRDLRIISGNQAREIAIVDSWSRDAIERSSEAFSGLNGSIKSLGDVVKEKGTLPLYIRDVAYFLLRSCVDGHCTKNLDTILKRVLNPYCYPYSSDLYKEDKVPEKCFCQDEDWGGYEEYCAS
ncbi:MAG: hypothetical protein KBD00_04440 [Candidatus Peribacteraceae bacterium]|nr:hypothetical protein [Candidatus Peribacteraceae bacterium]